MRVLVLSICVLFGLIFGVNGELYDSSNFDSKLYVGGCYLNINQTVGNDLYVDIYNPQDYPITLLWSAQPKRYTLFGMGGGITQGCKKLPMYPGTHTYILRNVVFGGKYDICMGGAPTNMHGDYNIINFSN